MNLEVSPPDQVLWIWRTLEEAGFETWIVGGAIRDIMLGRPADDWDFATRARPKQIMAAFRRTVPIGVDHGTVGVLVPDGTLYEVTTFRRDVETFGRRAIVEFTERIEDDLSRRDFTLNALAWHPGRDQFLDPWNGATDLDDRILPDRGGPSGAFRRGSSPCAARASVRGPIRIDDRSRNVASPSLLPSLNCRSCRPSGFKKR